ncbi:N-acetylmuramoyl-L-alanine amidase [Micromonospora sp. NBC_00362]|uniref:N-acetylmuramoyl-L-alanine amidase n=1 Tax=Micromonospora sp. NBC_00362 TaxID=2975975 RepID=UPI0022553350|nr:N-acetylmuramoyl-L-alanine amidase [Micromonospora sp. NBC_00362]MCX5121730.1 N-acetylmuramoyl-L-alanine amidase [Micromonospora sp. NBC_00362]
MAITWLADVLRQAGVTVVEEGDWRSRSAGGSFAPIGILWHHTAGANSSPGRPAPSLGVVIAGRPELPGPLCHALVDYNGVFHLISANSANHAGPTRASGPIPAGSGNAMLIGWEIDYSGDQTASSIPDQAMSAAQYSASVIATAAVLRYLGRDASYARGHRETSVSGKIDPSYINLDTMRADVARVMTQAGQAHALIVGGGGGIYHQVRYAGSAGWSGFQPLDGMGGAPAAGSAVAVGEMPDGSAQVLIVGSDGGIFHRVRNAATGWTGFQPLKGMSGAPAKGTDVAIAGMPDGSAQVLIVGSDGGIFHQVRNAAGGWTGFQPLDGMDGKSAKGSRVAIAGMPDGSAQVLIVGSDGGIFHRVRNAATGWTGFQPLKGMSGAPAKGTDVAIAGMPDGSAQVLIVGSDGGIFHQVRNAAGGWTGFQPLDGMDGKPAKGSRVAIAGMPDGSAQVLIVGSDGGIFHRVRNAATGWTGFQPLNGMSGTPAKGTDVAIAG